MSSRIKKKEKKETLSLLILENMSVQLQTWKCANENGRAFCVSCVVFVSILEPRTYFLWLREYETKNVYAQIIISMKLDVIPGFILYIIYAAALLISTEPTLTFVSPS